MPQPAVPTVTLTLTDEQAIALNWEAAAYHMTSDERLLTLVQPALTEMMRRYDDTRWQLRRRVLEQNTQLAAMVDREGAR